MQATEILSITQESIRLEEQRLQAERDPQMVAAHRAALRDFEQSLQQLRVSRRLPAETPVTG